MSLAAEFRDAGADPWEALAGRARELSALLFAIDIGELLADVPADPGARARHAAGVGLLAVMDRELRAIASELQGTSENDAAA